MLSPAIFFSGRAALPVLPHHDVCLADEEQERLSQLAARILRDEPALATTHVFGGGVSSGLDDGPALLFEDHSDIRLASGPAQVALAYRSLLLAGGDDMVVINCNRDAGFEQYCRDVVGLGNPEVMAVSAKTTGFSRSLPERIVEEASVFDRVVQAARRQRRLSLIPYLGSGSVWKLAGQIAAAAGARVRVAAPPPRLTRRVNDKLWFDQRVTEVFGREARLPNYHVFGPAAVAGTVAAVARRSERVVVKVPDSAGSAGNVVLDAAAMRCLPLPKVREHILFLLRSRGWQSEFPLLVGVWDCAVLSSPSVQTWVPQSGYGLPIVEGVFDQIVRGVEGEFIGAAASEVPQPLLRRLTTEAMQLACLFQHLGYFGRCSFDSIIVGTDWNSASVRWIECNGRWGGTSIPMTLANRLVGDWTQRKMMIVQRRGLKIRCCSLPEALKRLGNLLYRHNDDGTGVVVLTPGHMEHGSGLHFLLLGHDLPQVNELLAQVESLFLAGQQQEKSAR